MKRYKLLLLAVVAALVSGCYSDDTNLDYKTLDLPVIDNPENDLHWSYRTGPIRSNLPTACRSRPMWFIRR